MEETCFCKANVYYTMKNRGSVYFTMTYNDHPNSDPTYATSCIMMLGINIAGPQVRD